ncbi:MAG: DUF1822 family protein [Limnothrix sp. RL_2_0]|nr:DUF1822 family protein [Limnothrix sp. RL_2_0]
MLTDSEQLLKNTISLPITNEARQIAQKFSEQQITPEKAHQVYQNTLAVLVVNNYLRILQISTDLTQGESWDPLLQLSSDVADLMVIDHGRLECRPCENIEGVCRVPLEAQVDRIGYVAVQICEAAQEARLLGFHDFVEGDNLPIEQLRQMKGFIPYLLKVRPIVRLDQWLESNFDEAWHPAESVLQRKSQNLTHSTLGNVISRAKQIEWETYSELPPVSLLVMIKPNEDETMSIRVQLHPAIATKKPALAKIGFRFIPSFGEHLPPRIELSLLSETNQVLQKIVVRSDPPDDFIQFSRFLCNPYEKFKIQLKFETETITEKFST